MLRRRLSCRRFSKWAVFLFLLSGLGWGGAWLAARPVVAAYLCPACFGFEEIAPRIHVESVLSAAERVRLLEHLGQARSAIKGVFGALESDPAILVCAREDCDRRFGGGGTRGVTFGWHIVQIAPRGRNAVVLTHELAHAEFHRRAGFKALASASYPAWFDEGLAVLLSRDARFVDASGVGAPRCRGNWGEEEVAQLPSSMGQWMRELGDNRSLYTRAACKVARWYAAAGREGLLAFIDDLRDGVGFETAFARDHARRLPPAAPVVADRPAGVYSAASTSTSSVSLSTTTGVVK